MKKETFAWPEFLTVDVNGEWRCHKNSRSVTAVFSSRYNAPKAKIYTLVAAGDDMVIIDITEEYNA